MGVINMAHGEMIMLGPYSTFVVQEVFVGYLRRNGIGAYLVVALPVAFVVSGLFGIIGRALRHTISSTDAAGDPAGDLGHQPRAAAAGAKIFGCRQSRRRHPDWMTGGVELSAASP